MKILSSSGGRWVGVVVILLFGARAPGQAEAPYRIGYENGVTVEVIGVSVAPSRGKPFWTPDGGRVVEPPYEFRRPGYGQPGTRQQTYEVVARVEGLKGQPFHQKHRAINGFTVGYGLNPWKGAEVVKGIFVFDCSVPPGNSVLEFELGIAANNWQTVQAFKGPGAYGDGAGRVEVVEIQPALRQANPNVWFRANLAGRDDAALRMIAIDEADGVHVSEGRWWQGRDGHGVEAVFSKLPRERVKEFRVQSCAYEWKPVKGIQLKPAAGDLESVLAEHRVKRLIAQELRFKAADLPKVYDAIDRIVRGRVFEDTDEWAGGVRDLAMIGPPAIPAIVNELRRTCRPYGRSGLAIALRAIDDPRATPGLIEALADTPFGGSDYGGARTKDLAILHFMVSLDRDAADYGQGPTFRMGRPVNEISEALAALTGHSEGDQHRRGKDRALYEQASARWRGWWEQNSAAQTNGLPVLRIAAGADGHVPASESLTPQVPDAARLAAELKAHARLGNKPVLGRWTLLHLAIAHGRHAAVDAMVTAGADVNAAGEDGWTALHLAAALGQANAVENFLDHKGDVRSRTADGCTALHAAVGECLAPVHTPLPAPDRSMIEMLLEKGADVKAANGRGRTALHGVAAAGDGGLLKLLLDRGAEIHAKDANGLTPLHRAVACGNESTVDALLLQGADVNAKDAAGRTPIRYSSYSLYFPKDAPAIVGKLLEHGAEVDLPTMIVFGNEEQVAKAVKRNAAALNEVPKGSDDETPLQWAIRRKVPEVVKLLLDAGADPNLKDKGGNSPLHNAVFGGDTRIIGQLIAAKAEVNVKGNATPLYWACHRLSVEMVEQLLAAGADARATKEPESRSYLSITLQAARENDRFVPGAPQEKVERAKTIIKALLARGADVNERVWSAGYTPIYGASGELAELLLEHGAKLDVTNDEGDTPLHYAAVLGRTELAQFLLKHKVALEAKNKKGETPLIRAVGTFEPRGGVLEMLLEHKADVGARDGEGRTALHRATMIGSVKGVTALLEKGADVRAKDKDGATPLHHAAKLGRDELIGLLLKQGAEINATDSGGLTPLQWATRQQTRDVLNERGATRK